MQCRVPSPSGIHAYTRYESVLTSYATLTSAIRFPLRLNRCTPHHPGFVLRRVPDSWGEASVERCPSPSRFHADTNIPAESKALPLAYLAEGCAQRWSRS